MSGPDATHVDQPATFAFTQENLQRAQKIIAKYPPGRQQSAVLPLLDMAQRQHQNWVPRAAMDYIAGLLGMAPIRVYEVATFYTMFNLAPVGKYLIQICTTTPCWLRGSDEIVKACEHKLGIGMNETTPDGLFTMKEVECLGACGFATPVLIDDDFIDGVTVQMVPELVKRYR